MQKQIQNKKYFSTFTSGFTVLVLLLTVCYFPLFYRLGTQVIHIWDEAIYANNALEMYINKKYWVLHNNGLPNLYNVKPPLVIWLQCISLNIFGVSETAIRIPSALAALATAGGIFLFTQKYMGRKYAFLAVVVLITSAGFVRVHVARSGDLDSVLVFFITTYSLLFFDYLLDVKAQNNRRIFVMALLVFMAFMSKSLAGLMPLPGLLLGALLLGKGALVFKNIKIYLSGFFVLLLCFLYYYFREKSQPGYFKEVWFSEFSRYTTKVMSWHEHPFGFYWEHIRTQAFSFWIVFLPLGLLGFFQSNRLLKMITLLLSAFILYYFLLISIPSVKLDWYDAPMFPFMAIYTGLGIYSFSALLFKNEQVHLIFYFLVLGICIFPYKKILVQHMETLPGDSLEFEAYAVRELAVKHAVIINYKILKKTDHPEHLDALNFYLKKEKLKNRRNITVIDSVDKVVAGDKILCSDNALLTVLQSKFKTRELARSYKSILMEIE